MSSLTAREKATLETLFDMGGGYVLNFSDATIGTFMGYQKQKRCVSSGA